VVTPMSMNPEPPPSAPQPSKTFLAVSILVLAACLFLVSVGIACLTFLYDPCIFTAGVMIIPVPALLAFQQYFGTFRRRCGAASRAGSLALLVSAFPFLFALVLIYGGIALREMPPLGRTLGASAFAAFFFAAGIMNLRWSSQLQNAPQQPANERFRLSMREIFVAIGVVGAMLCTIIYVRGPTKGYDEDVTAEEARLHLPEGARRVSYARGSRGLIAYEFDTDEASFKKWVEGGIGSPESRQANVPLLPIVGVFTMQRYCFLLDRPNEPDEIEIRDGLHYTWSEEDRGVHAAFDRETNRGYFFSHDQ
jgi:hypothetical protein